MRAEWYVDETIVAPHKHWDTKWSAAQWWVAHIYYLNYRQRFNNV